MFLVLFEKEIMSFIARRGSVLSFNPNFKSLILMNPKLREIQENTKYHVKILKNE